MKYYFKNRLIRMLRIITNQALLLIMLITKVFASSEDIAYGKSLRDYVADHPFLMRATAQASLYAYPEERTPELRGLLEADQWKIEIESDYWIQIRKNKLNIIAFKGTNSIGELFAQASSDGWTDYTLLGAHDLHISVKKSYSNLFTLTGCILAQRQAALYAPLFEETFIYTGHSMGGAMAQIAGIESLASLGRKWSVIAYGVPPIFSQEGANVMSSHCLSSCLRLTKLYDIVDADLSLSSERGMHIGMHYTIPTSDAELALRSGTPEEPAILASIGIGFHSMKKYLETAQQLSLTDCIQ